MPLIGAAIGAAGAIGGSLIGASAAKSAAKTAARAQAEATAANNALAREFRAENTANLSPFMQRGNQAGAYINALLGLPGAEYSTQVPGHQQQTQPQMMNLPFGGSFMMPGQQQTQPRAVTTRVNPVSAQNAFDAYRGSTGYQFRLGQGMDALNQGYAAKGALRSGAAQKDFMRYGQGIASDEFGRYLGYLGGQQATGLSGASAIAGIGNTALNAMTQNNSNSADAASNAALIRGNASQNMWANVGGALGNLAQSSFTGGGGGSLNQTINTPFGMDALIAQNLR